MKKSKKIILSLIAVFVIGIAAYYAHHYIHYVWYDEYKSSIKNYDYEEGTKFAAKDDSDKKVSNMVLVAENSNLKLYTNTDTTEIAVYDKRTGVTTYSNPPDGDKDAVAIGVNKSFLKSQLIVNYYNKDRSSGTMNSYDLSTSKGQFQYEAINNGIRYVYTLGDLSSPTGIVPIYITTERLQIYLDKLEVSEARTIKGKYKPSETKSDFLELLEGSKKKGTLVKMNELFTKAGYTSKDYEADMSAASGEAAQVVTFTIPLEYRLTEDGLEVSLPTNQIKEEGGSSIFNIELLRYFGAAGSNETGYLVLPNGSGSLINFNNGKTKVPEYNQSIYGMDPLSMDYYVVENTEEARLPLFGIKREGSAILTTIENGETLANIIADVSGKVNSYNYAYPCFTVRGAEKLAMFGTTGSGADLPVVEKKMYDVNLKVHYTFLTNDYASYSGMATYYRDRLVKNGTLTLKEEADSIPFYVDIIGGVKQLAYILGVPYYQIYPMTTFKEAGIITEELQKADISNLRMNYLGWFNGGYYHDVPDKITVLSKLGGKRELSKLTDQVEAAGGKLYADVAFQNVTFISKRYRYLVESSRYYASGYTAFLGRVSPVSLRKTASMGYSETRHFLISPKFLPRYVGKFADDISKINVSGISLRDLGNNLHSDKKRTEVIDRETSKNVIIDQFERLDETGKNIMINSGDYYALPYTDDIINMPIADNSFMIIDEEIPFYQMVVHGAVDYTGVAINLSDTFEETDILLRLLEYGAAPHFTFSYKSSSDIKYSGLNSMYATQYENWIEDAKNLYHDVNEVLKHVTNSVIINHEMITAGVKKISYDNGVVIYINTNDKAVDINGITISARSYAMEGGGF